MRALSTDQVAALGTTGVAALSTSAVAALSTDQVVSLSTDQVVALGTAQVQSLATAAVAAMATDQLVAIETSDLAVLRTNQIVALTTDQIVALTTDQVGALTTLQVEALTADQISAFTTDQIQHLALGSPIVLDLDGDRSFSRSISDGAQFDLYDQGKPVATGWVSSGDGLLVLDRNGDGSINSGAELFGTSTRLANGNTARDGYEALREFDIDGDGRISAQDSIWSSLRVWVDSGTLGQTEAGELKTLDSLGITSLNLQTDHTVSKDNGNLVGITSSYQTGDGQTNAMADIWFVADRDAAVASNAPADSAEIVTDPAASLASPDGAVDAAAGADAGSQRGTDFELELPGQQATDDPRKSAALPKANPLAPTDLRSKVSSLAAAIGAHDEPGDADHDPMRRKPTGLAEGMSQLAHAAPPALSAMVDVMSRFDAHGNALLGKAPTAAPGSGLTVAHDKSTDWLSQGVLGSVMRGS